MQTPLTPLDFARRARKLYGDREAVVDGNLRLTYEQFFDRCDRWSATLQAFGVAPGDRIAYIAPNTHAQLESFYAVPQVGAVLVPINYRLTPDDFAYLINHSGARAVCAQSDYVAAVDSIRAQLPGVEQFVALDGSHDGWLDYEGLLAEALGDFDRPEIRESDLLTINYTSGTTSRPKCVMITHRNAYMNAVWTLVHHSMSCGDRYLWTLPAAGETHVCLRKVDPTSVFASIAREKVTMLCAAPTVLIGIACAPAELRAGSSGPLRILTAGAPPAAATIERVEGELGWTVTQVYGLTETAPFITICEPRPEHASLPFAQRATIKARQGVELVTSGELVVHEEGGREVPHDGETLGEIVV